MSTSPGLLDLIARGGSLPGFLGNQQTAANTALTNAQVPETQARTALTQAQVPEVAAHATQLEIANQIAQQRQRDIEKYATAMLKLGQQPAAAGPQSAAPQNAATPDPAPPGAPSPLPVAPGAHAVAQPAPQPVVAAAPAQRAPLTMADIISDPWKHAALMSQAGISTPYVFEQLNSAAELHKKWSDAEKEDLDNQEKRLGNTGDLITGYLANPTPENYAATAEQVKKLDPDVARFLPDPAVNPAPDEKALSLPVGYTKAKQTMLANAKTVQDTATSAQQEKTSKVESEDKQFELDLKKGAENGGGEAAIIQRFSPGGAVATRAALDAWRQNLPAGVAKATEEVNKVYENYIGKKASIESTTPAEVAKATAIAKAQLPVEQAKALYQNALQQGDKATADYASTIGDARQTVATADTIHKVIDLANSDNPTAAQQLKAMIPEFTNAVQNIKRLGGANSEGLATAEDKAVSELSSWRGNTPLNKDTLNALRPFVDTVANGAVSRANAQIDATNTAYGKKFGHEPLPVQYMQNPTTGQTIVSRDAGQTWTDAKTGAVVK